MSHCGSAAFMLNCKLFCRMLSFVWLGFCLAGTQLWSVFSRSQTDISGCKEGVATHCVQGAHTVQHLSDVSEDFTR